MNMTVTPPTAPHNPEAVPYSPMSALQEWYDATGDPTIPGAVRWIEEKDAFGRRKNAELRLALIVEEFREVSDELVDLVNGRGDRVNLAKELADLLYVVYGAAHNFEIPLEEVFQAVHRSNMTKVGESGKVERNKAGKILKGSHYEPPDVASIVLGDLGN